jgi:hypothetical protein
VTSDKLTMFRWLSLAKRDNKAAAEQALREIPADLLTDTRRHRLQRIADPASARASHFQQLLQDPRTPGRFEAVYVEARKPASWTSRNAPGSCGANTIPTAAACTSCASARSTKAGTSTS